MELDTSSSYDDCNMNYVQINKQPFSIKISRKDGLLVQIHHTITNNNNSRKKCLRFVNATFNDTSEQIAASDQAGNIFIIDLLSLKYWMLPTFGYCSAISYSTYKKNELLIGKDDEAIEIINTETGGVTGRLINHKSPVKWISYASGQPFCLTATNDEAFIWDLQTGNRIHRLTLHTTIKLKLVKFIPVSNNILACFADDTIQIWEYETGRSVLKISPEQWNNHQLNSVAFSKNGRILVVGGQTSKIFVICLKRITIKTFNLPKKNVVTKILNFLPRLFDAGENKILLVLTNNFTEYFVDIESGNIIQTISVNDINVDTFFFSENGKYTMYILNTGELNVYLTEKLFPSLSKFYPIEGQLHHQNDKKRYPGCDREKYHKTCTVSDTQVIVKPQKTASTLKSREISNQQLNEIQDKISCALNIDRLRSVLKEFGEYPENYRLLIWKNILKLPNNKLAYDALVNKGNHVVCESIENCYPLKNQSLLNSLKRLISCLCHWSPLFSQVHYLPLFVFPFVKIFRNDPLVCFEAVATIIVNWCQRWFEFFPFPPINILSLAENILCEWDEELLLWFTDHQVTSHLYAWTLLQTGFSEVLNAQEWVQLFDNILSNDPTYYIFAIVGYNIMCRSALLNLTDLSDFDLFYHSPTAVDIKRFITKINQMYSETKEENHPRKYMKMFTPLVKGDTYQIFNDYPKFMVDRQAEQVNAMKVEELELLKEQTRLTEARKEQEKEHEKALRKQIQNSHLRDLESKYKDALQEEEERLAEHRHKVSNMKRELRKREKQLLEDTREQILQQNADKRKTELSALLNDIDRKRVLQEMEMKDVEEELCEQYEDLLNQKKQLQLQLGLYDNTKNYPPPEHKILQQQQKCLSEEIRKLRQEVSSVHRDRRKEISDRLTAAEDLLQTVETQLAEELAERQTSLCAGQKNVEVLELEAKTCGLKKDVEKLLNALVKRRLQESKDKEKILRECRMDRKALINEQSDLVTLFPSGNNGTISSQQWAECDSSYVTDDNLPVTSSFEPSSPTSVYSTEPQSEFITENSYSNNGTRTKTKGPADCSRITNTNHCSNYFPNSNNNCDFLYRSNDFYLKEQEAIKSSMDLRHKLLHNRR